MELQSKQARSIYYWLVNEFENVPIVTIVDEFPSTSLTLPTISIEGLDIKSDFFELGNRYGNKSQLWRIGVFASNKVQRNEYAYKIFNNIEEYIPVYDYDEGFPPDHSPSQLGTLQVENLKLKPIPVFSELTEILYWRSEITFITTYQSIN